MNVSFLNIALMQTDLHWELPEANLAMLEEKIWQLPRELDVILLPEMFTTGFSMQTQLAEPWNFTSTKWLRKMAEQTKALVGGSFMVKENGNCYNRFVLMKPDGEAFTYNKRHLFTLAGEEKKYARGMEKVILNWKGWNICPMVCYDLRFPVWSRNVGLEYDILLYVASWPAARIAAWDALLKARAIENQAFCVGVNRVGTDGNGLNYPGHSVVYDFTGKAGHEITETDQAIIQQLDKNALEAFRISFPFYRDADAFELK